ncbi:MAG TPA: cytochrome P450 [Acidimicrobiales bacterium]|nr:cytochrome P450 [Acidimicrobiales bacterium]
MSDTTLPPEAFTPEFMLDPYAEVARLRDHDPVHYVDHMAMWFVTRHDDVKQLLADADRATPDRRAWEFYDPAPEGTYTRWLEDNNLLALERDDHRRVRRLVTAAFTPKAIARMETHIAEVVARFAAPLQGREGVVDLMGEFTDPIPNTVISRITGIPAAGGDEQRFRQLAQAVIANALPFTPEETRRQAEQALLELSSWVRQMAAERQAEPRDDLISDLVTTHDMGDQMTQDEIVSLVTGLVSAGSETTSLGALVAIISLLQYPQVFTQVKADRSLVPDTVLEIIRHGMGGPGGLPRYAVRDFELRGRPIKKGQMLMLSFGGANRDPAVFEDPDAFDITRDNSNLLMFGFGPHYCLGVHLAKAELRAAVDAMCDFLPAGAEVRADLMEFRPMGMFDRPVNLPVDFSADLPLDAPRALPQRRRVAHSDSA